jgi:replication fork protection complex subunit Csm3/Swi3
MDTDINDIWDLPLETPITNPDGSGPTSSPRASTNSNPPLFLPSSDEEPEDGVAAPNASAGANARRNDATNDPNPNPNPDIDALFDGLDDMDETFQELAPALDLDALRREADARNARAVRAELSAANIPAAESSTTASSAAAKNNSNNNNGGRGGGGGGGGGALDGLDGNGDGEEDGKKKRKPLPKLDETRLLGKDGFPQLLKDTKNFKPKGKDHEVIIISTFHLPAHFCRTFWTDATCACACPHTQAMDLDRVLQIYQFWSHKLYPKTRFKETVDRVEKLCHSKRMQVRTHRFHLFRRSLGCRLFTILLVRLHLAYGAMKPKDS